MAAGRSVFLIILRVGLLAVFSMDLGADLGPCGIIFCPFSVTLSTSSSFLQIIYDIGTGFLIFHCFATKMLKSFCKSIIFSGIATARRQLSF